MKRTKLNHQVKTISENGEPSLHDALAKLEEDRILRGMENNLDHIAKAVILILKLTGEHVFLLGKLMNQAEKLCKEKGKSFPEWVKENIGYKQWSVRKWMAIATHLSEWEDVAKDSPINILNQIASKSFPEDLKNALFMYADFKKMNGKQFNKIVADYKEAGIKKVEADLQKLNGVRSVNKQVQPFLTLFKRELHSANNVIKSFQNITSIDASNEFEISLETYEPQARDAILTMYSALIKYFTGLEQEFTGV